MTATLSGVVLHAETYNRVDRHTGRITYNHCRIVARQDGRNGLVWHATLPTGPGNDGMTRAQAMRDRLQRGVRCEARGAFVSLRRDDPNDQGDLMLNGVDWIRGGDAAQYHQPAPAVVRGLRQLEVVK